MPDSIKFDLFGAILRLEKMKGKRISYGYIAERSGVSRTTIYNLTTAPAERVDLDTLTKLLRFFQSEGLNLTVDDLLVDPQQPHRRPAASPLPTVAA